MEKVNILLSTYNGEKFIEKQLDSLLEQTYENIDVYIRDDGSKDRTVEIIREYQKKNIGGKRIIFLEDKEGNLGYVRSFLKLVRCSEEADYYAFCDQDDYWLENKIERAVNCLKKREQSKCLLYSGGYSVCDGDLNVLEKGHIPTGYEKLSVGKSLSLYDGGWILGFTLVFNKELKKKAFDNNVLKMYSHDVWVQAVGVGNCGEFHYDDTVTTHFRRHGNTTSIAESKVNRSIINAWVYRFKQAFSDGDMFQKIGDSIISYKEVFGESLLTKEDQQFFKRFGSKSTKISDRLRKVMYPYRLKQKLLVEIAWRIAILLGKI